MLMPIPNQEILCHKFLQSQETLDHVRAREGIHSPVYRTALKDTLRKWCVIIMTRHPSEFFGT